MEILFYNDLAIKLKATFLGKYLKKLLFFFAGLGKWSIFAFAIEAGNTGKCN